ncbi:hypothetical protein JW964_28855 [candidate division KSB1 bacterium]|nr:hypothetical protein [candidate division KSB1 bacterium]
MKTHHWGQHPDQIEISTRSGEKNPIRDLSPNAGFLIFWSILFFLEFFPVQVISKTYFGDSRTSNLNQIIENLELNNGEMILTFSRDNLRFITFNMIPFFISQGKKSQKFFPEDSGLLSKIWSVIWRIPWNTKFGILLEWVPLFISLAWLFIWYLIMVVVIRRAMAMGEEDPDTFFIQFTRFAQVFYLFCCIQAVF